jgi:UPF0755 protein
MLKYRRRLTVFAVIFLVLIVFPFALNKFYNGQLAAVSSDPREPSQLFVVKPGQPVAEIAQNLQKENLIKSALAFRLLVARMGVSKNVQAGDFRLNRAMPARQIATELTHGIIDVWVTLPEGLRVEEEADKIASSLKFTGNDVYQFDRGQFIKIAREGYMFPDTYLIAKDATAAEVAQKLQATFDQKVSKDILTSGAKNNLSASGVIILASLVEREAKTDAEKPQIASVILNRLKADMPLQVDATIQYAKGYDATKKTWWSQVSTADYRSVSSPYNTYTIQGLPTGPISNPGLASIMAAASPAETDYYYYLHDSQGQIHFAKTEQEHNRNIQQFLLK